MAEQTTYPCLVCRSPADRVDSGTIFKTWEGNRFVTQRERITFCPLCQTRRVQIVTITVEDGGETDRRYITLKQPKEDEP